ncbi:MAG: ISAzo13 family transposase [Dehalococcoidia bacterium]
MTTLVAIVEPETAGDPMSDRRWVRSSLRSLSRRLAEAGHQASPPTVRRLLHDLGLGLHANAKQVEGRATHPDRDTQFQYIARQRATFTAAGLPQVSVDSKKKELVGNFRNAGRAWNRAADAVNVHDFPADALGRAVPYGIYDLTRNQGSVYVGQSADTPRFAVEALVRWWVHAGQPAYPTAREVLVLADAGGSNSAQSRVWKQQLQEQVCDRFGLSVTVCHYPTGCSKWNPIEHRLFGPISLNWAGQPLRTWETLVGYVRGTTTTTGLQVQAQLLEGTYATGERVSDADMDRLNLQRHAVCPGWNYTLRPRPGADAAGGASTAEARREVVS